MIRLFVSDIDGCLSTPYVPYRIERLANLRRLVERAGRLPSNAEDERLATQHASRKQNANYGVDAGLAPAFTICSGRAYPYVEAMTQLLGITTPALFESGAGMFDPITAQWKWHPSLDEDATEKIREVKSFLKHIVSGTSASVDMAKETQAAIVCPENAPVQRLYPDILDFVTTQFPDLQVFQTFYSVDVVQRHLTKREGMIWLAEECNIASDDVAFVGDSDGDIGALLWVGRSYAPANAASEVKHVVDMTTVAPELEGVFEAYKDASLFAQ